MQSPLRCAADLVRRRPIASINHRLVRGLDYYSRTVFEWVTTELGAQGTTAAAAATMVWSSRLAVRPARRWLFHRHRTPRGTAGYAGSRAAKPKYRQRWLRLDRRLRAPIRWRSASATCWGRLVCWWMPSQAASKRSFAVPTALVPESHWSSVSRNWRNNKWQSSSCAKIASKKPVRSPK